MKKICSSSSDGDYETDIQLREAAVSAEDIIGSALIGGKVIDLVVETWISFF